jgi:hypothetical protein
MGLVPPVESILISDHSMPVAICTEATCGIAMLSSLLPNIRDLTRLTRCGVTTIRVGNIRLPLVQRLAEKASVDGTAWFGSAATLILVSISPVGYTNLQRLYAKPRSIYKCFRVQANDCIAREAGLQRRWIHVATR